MADIILTTLNAKYAHTAFGLRYLLANLGPLRERACILEFDIHQRPLDILETILAGHPRIIGFGVYVWNVVPTTQLAAALKRLHPDIVVVLGGPEVSHEIDQQEIARLADYIIPGEADLAFRRLCGQILDGERPSVKICAPEWPDFRQLALPYNLYTNEDIAHRVIYVEASRGCPFSCEFCLSSLDIPVRRVPLEAFFAAMRSLLDRGARRFKFVDRTFNLDLATSRRILEFFLEQHRPGLFLHFEMIPDRMPDALRDVIRRFPPGALQFEAGVQSFNPDVLALISRRQDNAKLEENFRFLREQTGVHLHADLIAGLPGEDVQSFASGFDRLVKLRPQEIQIELLKRLRGAPIVRHDRDWGMVYSPVPPCEVLQTRLIDFATMQRLWRFARYWDLTANSGNFVETAPMIWAEGSPFWSFLRWSDWLYDCVKRSHGISLPRLAEFLFEHLTSKLNMDAAVVAQTMARDYQRAGRTDWPSFLRSHIVPESKRQMKRSSASPRSSAASDGQERQRRHLVQKRAEP
ncbi:MAG: DUF4080 domain-containing protein [Verrucomicrobia bacterium]|nr:DUF4080 domain-containing protein [Verrucomicrobiota bacterium]